MASTSPRTCSSCLPCLILTYNSRPISGPVITHLGWRWSFRIFNIACSILFLLQFFCSKIHVPNCSGRHSPTLIPVPETTYSREIALPIQTQPRAAADSDAKEDLASEKRNSIPSSDPPDHHSSVRPPKSYLQELRVWNGFYKTKSTFASLLLRPFLACLTPVCLWASLLYGVAITWLVLIATSVAQIFSAPRMSSLHPDIRLVQFYPSIPILAYRSRSHI